MNRALLTSIFAVTLVAAHAGLSTDSRAGWYVSGNAGGHFLMDSDLVETGPNISADGELEFDTGYGVNGAIGYGWNNVRIEGEVSYRQADIDKITVNSVTVGGTVFSGLGLVASDVDGEVSSLGFMANGWYDFDTGTDWVPYVGVGVGTAQINAEISSIGSIPVSFDESDWVFAYQAGLGMGFNVTSSATIQLGYRYFGTTDPEFESGGVTEEAEYRSHNVEVGLRIRF